MAVLRARSYADWFALWFAKNCAANGSASGESALCRWSVHDDTSLRDVAAPPEKDNSGAVLQLNKSEARQLQNRLSTKYRFGSATTEPAKTSVTALRRRAMEVLEDEEAAHLFKEEGRRKKAEGRRAKGG